MYVTGSLSALRGFEKVTLAYMAVTAAIAIAAVHEPGLKWPILTTHALYSLLILALAYVPFDRYKSVRIVRDWYILLLFPALFKELSVLTQTLFPYYLEPALIASEVQLLALWRSIAPGLPSGWLLTECMAFAYWFYYPLLPGVAALLYFRHRRAEYENYMLEICATLIVCYLIFILAPVRGPHHAMPGVNPLDLEGGLFQSIIFFVQRNNSTVGAAFPSSHVAVAWIAMFRLRQIHRRLYYLMMPFALVLSISVFYLRYHYALDAVFGFVLAVLLHRVFRRFLER